MAIIISLWLDHGKLQSIVNDPNHDSLWLHHGKLQSIVNNPNHDSLWLHNGKLQSIVNDPNDDSLYVCSKLARCIGILSKAKQVFPRLAMVYLYYTLAYPYLMYCNEVWGCVQESKLLKLNIIQKQMIKIICNVPYLEHTNNLFQELGVLKGTDINQYSLKYSCTSMKIQCYLIVLLELS